MTSPALEGLKSNINNYKGVMLCTRPNENIGAEKDRPFVSRVDPKAQLGINPVKKVHSSVARKHVNPVLARHRAWLNDFKLRIKEKKINDEVKDIQDKERFERIREQATLERGKYQDKSQMDSSPVKSEEKAPAVTAPKPNKDEEEKPVKAAAKKKESFKPKWALTEQQVKDEEDQDLDDLLAFTNNLDYNKYINDLEVKDMVVAMKKRIDELREKEEDNWKNKIVDAWNKAEERQSIQPNRVDMSFDGRSDCRSVASESRSAASERSQQSITELKAKLAAKEKKEWDTLSTSTNKKNAVTLEERIAKHVADEIIRNNTQFKHFHSNASVRKILEKEAQKHMEDIKGIKVPEIVSNKEYFTRKDVTDPNNLPYLHRNPAI